MDIHEPSDLVVDSFGTCSGLADYRVYLDHDLFLSAGNQKFELARRLMLYSAVVGPRYSNRRVTMVTSAWVAVDDTAEPIEHSQPVERPRQLLQHALSTPRSHYGADVLSWLFVKAVLVILLISKCFFESLQTTIVIQRNRRLITWRRCNINAAYFTTVRLVIFWG